MARHIVAKVGDIPPNCSKLVTIRGRQIALFHVNDSYFALTDRCPHEGGSLCAGLLVGRLTSKEPGTYEYVCTSPGHWVIRWVRLIATADIDAWLQANVLATPAAPAASSPQQH